MDMKSIGKLALLVSAAATSLPSLAEGPQNRAAPDGVFRNGEVVLFVGDSITHGGRGKTLNHYLGHGYAAEIAMRYLGYHPDAGLCFLNRGVSGHGTRDLLKHWDADVLHLKFADSEGDWRGPFPDREGNLRPDVVSILVGINDYLSKSPQRHATPDEYAANLEQLVSSTLAAFPKCRIVVCEPFRMPADSSPDFIAMQKAAKEIATRHKLCFVDFQRLFSDVLPRENPNVKYWFWDKAHPTYAAHIRMADWWLKRVGEFNRAHCALFASSLAGYTGLKASDFKVKLVGVSIESADVDEFSAKPLPPDKRIVVMPGNLAVFHVEYDFPEGVKSRLFLGPNFDESKLGGDPFGTSASGLLSGKGSVAKVVILGAGGSEPYEQELLLKSVRISGEIESKEGAPRNGSFFICDAPVNVLFANKGDADGSKAKVLDPRPAPAPDTSLGVVAPDKPGKTKSSTPAGFTDDLDAAFVKAKAEGKFVYACFSGSDWCGWCIKLEREVFSKPEFISGVEDDYVLVFIDSPEDKSLLSEHAKSANQALVEKYRIKGFPTAIVFDGDGKKVGETGYRKGGAAAYVDHLMDFRKRGNKGK